MGEGTSVETKLRMYEKAALRAADADDEEKFERYAAKWNEAWKALNGAGQGGKSGGEA